MTGEGGAGGNEVILGYISLHTSKEKSIPDRTIIVHGKPRSLRAQYF